MKKDKLVTVAIHTMDRAKMLKAVLEAEGIETILYNLDLLKPILSAGVRVRIHEGDLPRALQIIEEMENQIQVVGNRVKRVLIPVDFSDYSEKICKIGFQFAKHINAEIVLLHAYFMPEYSLFPNRTETVYDFREIEQRRKLMIKKESSDFKLFVNDVKQKIGEGKLPDCKFITIMEEGVPEDTIVDASQKYNTALIVMGTRGKDIKELELIGSVTAEVMERSQVPILAIPENVDTKRFNTMKNVIFATNFDDRMLISLDRVMNLFKTFTFNLFFTHFEQKEDTWNEIKLAGISEYFTRMYPNIHTEYSLIKNDDCDDVLTLFDGFIAQNKIDLIILNTHRRNLFMRLFNPSMARRMLFHSDTPILVVRT